MIDVSFLSLRLPLWLEEKNLEVKKKNTLGEEIGLRRERRNTHGKIPRRKNLRGSSPTNSNSPERALSCVVLHNDEEIDGTKEFENSKG